MRLFFVFLFVVDAAFAATPKDVVTRLLSTIDQSANPCTNFYDFVCGKTSTRSSFRDEFAIDKEREELLLDPKPSTSKSINKIKQYYQACNAERKKISEESDYQAKTLKEAIIRGIERVGPWPLLDSYKRNAKSFNLTELLVKTHKTFTAPYTINVKPLLSFEFKDNSVNRNPTLMIEPGFNYVLIFWDKDKYNREADKRETERSLEEVLEGIPHDKKSIEKAAAELAGFNEELARLARASESVELTKVQGIGELQKIIPMIDWNFYFQSVAPTANYEYLKHARIVLNRALLVGLHGVLKKTPSHVLANYLIYRYLKQGLIRKSKEALGCENLMGDLRYATSALYMRHYFNKSDKPIVEKMVENVKSVVIDEIAKWKIDPEDKVDVSMTIRAMNANFGDVPFLYDDKQMDAFYDSLKIQPNTAFAEMEERIDEWNNRRDYSIFHSKSESPDGGILSASADTIEVDFGLRTLNIAPGVLRQHDFDSHLPRCVNYARLGVELAKSVNRLRSTIPDTSPSQSRLGGFVYDLALKEDCVPRNEAHSSFSEYNFKKKEVQERIASSSEFARVFGCPNG